MAARLIENPFLGESYGNNIYKIRLADKSKGKGTSGGFRILYYAKIDDDKILLITIFDKSEIDTIKKKDANILFRKVMDSLDSSL